jgi:hypothetical protein
MTFAGPNFVIAIVVVMTVGWLINNWIRAKHGYPLEDEWGGKTALTDVVVQLLGVTAIGGINITGGDLSINS